MNKKMLFAVFNPRKSVKKKQRKENWENSLLVCHPEDAASYIEKDPTCKSSLVITEVVPKGIAYVVQKDEFLDYIHENHHNKESQCENKLQAVEC